MAYILDDTNIDSTIDALPIVTDGSDKIVTAKLDMQAELKFSIGPDNLTKYTFPTTKAPSSGYVLGDPTGTGQVQWVLSSGGGTNYNFQRLTSTGPTYTLLSTDNGIEIVDDACTNVIIPLASVAGGGRVYLISRDSNTVFYLTCQGADTIDGYSSHKIDKKNSRMTILSNGVNKWYII